MRLAAARRAWHRWQAAAGPWQGWSICPALLSPELEDVPDGAAPNPAPASRLAEAIRPLLEPGGALCLLDLDPLLGVQTAARLTALAHPVLRHRIITNFHAQSEGVTTDQITDRLLETVPMPRSGM